MPGILGVISKGPSEQCEGLVRRMLAGDGETVPCIRGSHSDRDLGLYIGWACHPGSFADTLPVLNEKRDCWLALTGEAFPRPGELAELKGRGHEIFDESARYLIHLYEEAGSGFLRGLNGLFAGVLADHRSGECFLFNDRFGLKRLFVHEDRFGTYFASRLGPLLAVIPSTREYDPKGLAEWLTCGGTLGERSLYRDLKVVPGASLWTFRGGQAVSRKAYFAPSEWESQGRLALREFREKAASLFPEVSRRHARAGLPVGLSLTGGIDTRMVVAALDAAPGSLSYTFAGLYRDSCDVAIARRIAELRRLRYERIVLGEEFLEGFPQFLDAAVRLSGGYLGMSGAASLYVNSLARRIAPVRLTGNFGGEVFRGVRAFKSLLPRTRIFDPSLAPALAEAVQTFEGLARRDPLSFSLFVQAPHQGYGLSCVEDSQIVVRTPFLDAELAQLMYQGPRSYAAGLDLSISIIRLGDPRLLGVPTDLGYLGSGGPIIRALRAGYSRFLFKGEYWTSRGRWRGAGAINRIDPRLSPERFFLGRHKYQHFPYWIRNELADYVRTVLGAGGPLPDCLDRKGLAETVARHIDGRGNFYDEIDRAMTIAVGHRLLLSGAGQDSPELRVPEAQPVRGPLGG
jgi:asparagine synthase (glutamine-hydrolysing)